MAIIKCKMCGGDLEIQEGLTVAECEYCGTKQTVPTSKDEGLQGLFNRANTLRLKSEFDRAESLYEKIIQSDETQAEAYWGLILCKYGIEYVEDPATFKRIPTCHRASFDSIIADEDYKSALKYADSVQKSIYEEQANEIYRIQKEILALSQKEEPYDVFICYKETDETGKRTQDSVIANDIYHQLTGEGFKVFYAAITLEDKLGSAYEPCIFAALNSAKVMLAIGTKPEYFNSVWVKNEWSRFLKIIKKDASKLLIPCYRDMDAYELPDEFAHLQAQDMSKVGFISDLLRGIKKVISNDEPAQKEIVHEVVQTAGGANADALLKRGYMALEDGEWDEAKDFFNRALDINAECVEAYLGCLMSDVHVRYKEELDKATHSFDGNGNYQKVCRFADEELKNYLDSCIKTINYREEVQRMDKIYNLALKCIKSAEQMEEAKKDEETGEDYDTQVYDICYIDYKEAAELLGSIINHKDSRQLHKECLEKAEISRKDILYRKACAILEGAHIWIGKKTDTAAFEEAISIFESLEDYKNSKDKIKEILADKNRAFEKRERDYQDAIKLFEAGDYDKAGDMFFDPRLADYKDSKEYLKKCNEFYEVNSSKKDKEIQEKNETRTRKTILIGALIGGMIALLIGFFTDFSIGFVSIGFVLLFAGIGAFLSYIRLDLKNTQNNKRL